MERNQLEENLDRYLKAVNEVRGNNELSREEKLKLLLEPIVNMQIDPSLYERWHKFAREDYINLKEELDLSSLEMTPDHWDFEPNWKLDNFRDLNTRAEIIYVDYSKFLPEVKKTPAILAHGAMVRTSVHELYRDWLPHLNQERIQSKSLLDQILVCYTIKRAQNGDNQASKKLISLYEGRAASPETFQRVKHIIEYRVKRKTSDKKTFMDVLNKKESEEEDLTKSEDLRINVLRGMKWIVDDKNFHPGADECRPWTDAKDVRQLAKIYLTFIIMGFTPKIMLDSLIEGKKSDFLPLPRAVYDVLLHYYGEYIPGIIDKYVAYQNNLEESCKEPNNVQKIIEIVKSMIQVIDCFGPWDSVVHVNKEHIKLKERIKLFENMEALLQPEQAREIQLFIVVINEELLNLIAPFFDTLLDPYTPINSNIEFTKPGGTRAARILSACYRPQKMGPRQNLTTWLFGGEKLNFAFGKLYQMLCDHYSLEVHYDATVPLDIYLEFLNALNDADDDELAVEERFDAAVPLDVFLKALTNPNDTKRALGKHYDATVPLDESLESSTDDDEPEFVPRDEKYLRRSIGNITEEPTSIRSDDLQDLVKKANISERDLGFLLDYSGEFTLDKLAEKYNLTKDQVRYKYKTLLKKIQSQK
jgi:hypothetical protein